LCYCNKITDSGLGHLGSLEELTNLELRCLVRITCIGISSIAIGCKSLIELDLKRCYSVDDASLGALARNALNLRQVNNLRSLALVLAIFLRSKIIKKPVLIPAAYDIILPSHRLGPVPPAELPALPPGH